MPLLNAPEKSLRSMDNEPRHFRIEPAHAIRSNDKIRWIKNVPLDEFQDVAVYQRPEGFH